MLNISTFYLLQCEKGKKFIPNVILVLARFFFNYNFIFSQNSNISLKTHFLALFGRGWRKEILFPMTCQSLLAEQVSHKFILKFF